MCKTPSLIRCINEYKITFLNVLATFKKHIWCEVYIKQKNIFFMFPQISYIQSSKVSFVCIISILRFLNSKNKNVRYFVIYFAARTLKSPSIPFLCFCLFSKLGIFCNLVSCLLSNLYFAIKPINRNFYLSCCIFHF